MPAPTNTAIVLITVPSPNTRVIVGHDGVMRSAGEKRCTYLGSYAEASIRGGLTSSKVVVRPNKLLDLIDDSEQRL